jgi:hypothetical protein
MVVELCISWLGGEGIGERKKEKAVIGSYGSISINLTEFTFLYE